MIIEQKDLLDLLFNFSLFRKKVKAGPQSDGPVKPTVSSPMPLSPFFKIFVTCIAQRIFT